MTEKKIVSLEELGQITAKLKKQGKTIAQCHGCFDLLHPGHIKHFESAKAAADVLVVTLTPDRFVNKGPGRPVFNEKLRMESIAALEAVDYVALNNWPTAIETVKIVKPDLYVKGQDYKDSKQDITGNIAKEEDAVRSVGGRIYFTEDITFSSSSLLNAHFSPHNDQTRKYLGAFRKKYSSSKVIEAIDDLKDVKVLVIGDTIIDEYHYCLPLGKSTKSSNISAAYLREEVFAGGVLAVANHLEQFAGKVELVTMLGKENPRQKLIDDKLSSSIGRKYFYRQNSPTNCKRRYLDRYLNIKLFEVTFINDHHIEKELEQEVIAHLKKKIKDFDVVLVADFGHGFLSPGIIKFLEASGKYLAVNAQTNSNNYGYNYITKYHRCDYVSIDERELRLPFGDNYGDLEKLVLQLKKITKAKNIQITLGQQGTMLYEKNKFNYTPAFATSVRDSVGAGDAVLSVTALCAFKKKSAEMVGFIGNCVGALAVQIIGNEHPVYKKELTKYIQHFLK